MCCRHATCRSTILSPCASRTGTIHDVLRCGRHGEGQPHMHNVTDGCRSDGCRSDTPDTPFGSPLFAPGPRKCPRLVVSVARPVIEPKGLRSRVGSCSRMIVRRAHVEEITSHSGPFESTKPKIRAGNSTTVFGTELINQVLLSGPFEPMSGPFEPQLQSYTCCRNRDRNRSSRNSNYCNLESNQHSPHFCNTKNTFLFC